MCLFIKCLIIIMRQCDYWFQSIFAWFVYSRVAFFMWPSIKVMMLRILMNEPEFVFSWRGQWVNRKWSVKTRGHNRTYFGRLSGTLRIVWNVASRRFGLELAILVGHFGHSTQKAWECPKMSVCDPLIQDDSRWFCPLSTRFTWSLINWPSKYYSCSQTV